MVDLETDFVRLSAAPTAWGDYGRILVHGMTARLPRHDGQLQLERAGRLVPPLSFPGGSMLATDEMRRWLEERVPALGFLAVKMARVVNIDWESWDWEAADPPYYPKGGEPENYIVRGRHNRALAAALSPCWECLVPEGITQHAVRDSKSRGGYRVVLEVATWNQSQLFRSEGGRAIFCTAALGAEIEARAGKWVSVTSVDSTATMEDLEVIPPGQMMAVVSGSLGNRGRRWWEFWKA